MNIADPALQNETVPSTSEASPSEGMPNPAPTAPTTVPSVQEPTKTPETPNRMFSQEEVINLAAKLVEQKLAEKDEQIRLDKLKEDPTPLIESACFDIGLPKEDTEALKKHIAKNAELYMGKKINEIPHEQLINISKATAQAQKDINARWQAEEQQNRDARYGWAVREYGRHADDMLKQWAAKLSEDTDVDGDFIINNLPVEKFHAGFTKFVDNKYKVGSTPKPAKEEFPKRKGLAEYLNSPNPTSTPH